MKLSASYIIEPGELADLLVEALVARGRLPKFCLDPTNSELDISYSQGFAFDDDGGLSFTELSVEVSDVDPMTEMVPWVPKGVNPKPPPYAVQDDDGEWLIPKPLAEGEDDG